MHKQHLIVKIFVGELPLERIGAQGTEDVSISTACRIYKLFKETNAVDAKSRCKPRPHTRQMDMQLELYAIGYVLEHPNIYLFELCQMPQG